MSNLANVSDEFHSKTLSASLEYINAANTKSIIHSIGQTQNALYILDKEVLKAQKAYYKSLQCVEEKSIEHGVVQSVSTEKALQKVIETAKEKEQMYKDKIALYNTSMNSLQGEIGQYHAFYKSFVFFEKQ